MGKKKGAAAADGEAKPKVEPKPEPAVEAKAPEEPKKAKEEEEGQEEVGPVVKELQALDDKCLEIERRFQAQIEELRKKCSEEQAPILAERTKVLGTAAAGADAACGTPALKGFWLEAMQNSPHLRDNIEEWDEPVLQYLGDVTKSYIDAEKPGKGFKLEFHFAENPYFSNKSLWKEYHLGEGSPYNSEVDVTEIVVSEISWKEGKNVTVEVVKKKAKGGGAKKKAPKATEEPIDSFFRNFFRHLKPGMPLPPEMNLMDARQLCGDDDDEEDEDEKMMGLLMENDYEMGVQVRDHIIPYAVRYYTGEATPKNAGDDDDDEDFDDDDDDDDEDDDSEEEEEEAPPPAKGKKAQPKKKGGGPSAAVGKQEECKQQ